MPRRAELCARRAYENGVKEEVDGFAGQQFTGDFTAIGIQSKVFVAVDISPDLAIVKTRSPLLIFIPKPATWAGVRHVLIYAGF